MNRSIIAIGVILATLPLAVTNTFAEGALNAELSSAIKVRTAQAAVKPLQATQATTGVINAYRKATVAAKTPGQIVERLAEPGTYARAGDVLLRIDPEQATLALRQAQAFAEARRVQAEHAQHEYQRGERLRKKNVVSQDTLDDLRFAQRTARAELQAALVEVANAQRTLGDTQIEAPFDGQVEQVFVQVGDYINPGQPALTQTDFTQARVVTGVTGRDAAVLQPGQSAKVLFEDLGGAQFDANITAVGRVKDAVTGTFPVELRLKVPNDDMQLREGMVGTVTWDVAQHRRQTLSIPSAAVVKRAGQMSVYVIDNNRANLSQIRIGRSDGKRVEVLSGLQPGQLVVIEGQFALRDGALVDVTRTDL